MTENDAAAGQPPEEENNPIDLHKRRRWFRYKVRDDVQAWYEGSIQVLLETVLWAAGAWVAYVYLGAPFELLIFVMLAELIATSGAIWRVYVR